MSKKKMSNIHVGVYCELFLSDWSGAERMLAGLAEAMIARGHRATLLARPPAGAISPKIPLTPMPEGCNVLHVDLNSAAGRAAALDAVREADLDVLVAPCTKRDFLNVLHLAADTGTPLVSAEAIHPKVLTHERWGHYEHYAALAACDRIQVLLEPYRQYYPKALHARIDAIGNPAPPPQEIDWATRAAKPQKTLLAMGRFDEVDKQFSLLLRTWALLAPEFPDWGLTLVGDGSAWALYHAMVKAMGPEARAVIHGSVLDPSPFYSEADLFCMPSRQEGFGLVLGAAAAYSLPLVGIKSCEAARNLIPSEGGAGAEAKFSVQQNLPLSLTGSLRIDGGSGGDNGATGVYKGGDGGNGGDASFIAADLTLNGNLSIKSGTGGNNGTGGASALNVDTLHVKGGHTLSFAKPENGGELNATIDNLQLSGAVTMKLDNVSVNSMFESAMPGALTIPTITFDEGGALTIDKGVELFGTTLTVAGVGAETTRALLTTTAGKISGSQVTLTDTTGRVSSWDAITAEGTQQLSTSGTAANIIIPEGTTAIHANFSAVAPPPPPAPTPPPTPDDDDDGGTSITVPSTNPDGSTTKKETKPDGTVIETTKKPDGTVIETTKNPDGTEIEVETKTDGTVIETIKQPDGTQTQTTKTEQTQPSGATVKTETVVHTDKDGNVTASATVISDGKSDTLTVPAEVLDKVAGTHPVPP